MSHKKRRTAGKTVQGDELYNQQGMVTNTDNTKRVGRRYSSAHYEEKRGERNSSVLMRENRRLPKSSLDDGSTAELSGLKSAHKR